MPNTLSDGILNNAELTAKDRPSPTGGIEFLDNLLYPNLQQEVEFGQQVALTKYLNGDAYKDKFRALRELGINPVTAAEALTGASSGAASPSSSVGAAAKSLEGISSAVGAVGDLADKFSSANERNRLLESRRNNLIADTYQKYVDAGYTSEMAKNMAIANAFLPTEKYLGLVALQGQIDNLHAEWLTMMQGISESKKRIEELDAQIKLAASQGNLNDKLALEAEKRTLLIESQTTEQNWYNNKMKLYGIDPRNPIENNVFMTGVKEGKTSYDSQLGIVRDLKYNEMTGQYDSQEEHAYSIAYNTAVGEAFASWTERPNTLWSMIVDISKRIGRDYRAGKVSREEARQKIQQEKEFKSSYYDFKGQLKTNMKTALRKACDGRYNQSISQDEYESLWKDYFQWKEAYNGLTEEAYSDLLLNKSH